MRRSAFEKRLTEGLRGLGFSAVPGPRDVPETALFWKAAGDLRLLLAVEYHRFYDEAFTASLYLGRTIRFALYPPGYPENLGWKRVGDLVTELEDEDYWWRGFSDDNIRSLVAVLPTFEARFLRQDKLIERVREVEELRRLEMLAREVAELIPRLDGRTPKDLTSQPSRYPAAVPPAWFWAAELVLRSHGNKIDRINGPAKVRRLALDSWRYATPPGVS
jgi:hypothetical protein